MTSHPNLTNGQSGHTANIPATKTAPKDENTVLNGGSGA